MPAGPFQFKQFTIHQERSAMKVGTDGVLLGAWTPLTENLYSILDIGAGTGLIALMLAQRSGAEQIDALEIDGDAYEECVENFEASPWNDRLFCYHASLEEFVEEMDERYDLIVANPPFYTEEHPAPSDARAQARSAFSLPFETLMQGASVLLSGGGHLSIIVPFREENRLLALGEENGLFLQQVCRVQGTPESEVKRSLLYFGREEHPTQYDSLIIETERHQYTPDYITLTKDFYLKM